MKFCDICDCHSLCQYVAQETHSDNLKVRCATIFRLASEIVEKNIDNDDEDA